MGRCWSLLLLCAVAGCARAFTPPRLFQSQQVAKTDETTAAGTLEPAEPVAVEPVEPVAVVEQDETDDAKFGFGARIESVKCVVAGALSGGIAVAPASLINDCIFRGQSVAQWEFDTDMGALEGALFAIVYRYCIREDTNPQLKDGVVGAFFLTRTLTRIKVPTYCSSVPLYCGPPLGYLDWNMLSQIAINGAESAILFSAAASGMEYCFKKGYISKFPG